MANPKHFNLGIKVKFPWLLEENNDGLILHWEFFEDTRSDSKLLRGALEAIEKMIGTKLHKVVTDRGLSDEKCSEALLKIAQNSLPISARARRRN